MNADTQPQTAPLAISVAEAAARLGVSRGTVYRAVKAGTMPGIRLAKRRFVVPVAALDEWLRTSGGNLP